MIKNLSVMIECSSGRCPTVETVKKYIKYISKMGYKTLYLGLTDGYKIKSEPYFNYKRGGYNTEELREIDACGKEYGLEVIGSIQTLAHLGFMSRYNVFKELFDTQSCMLVDNEKVLELVRKMLEAISEGLSSRRIFIGFDEAEDAGTGNYKRLHKGPIDRKVILLRHLNKVIKIAKEFGYTCEIWHDMMLDKGTSVLSAEDVKAAIPKDVRVFLWDYFADDENKLRTMISDLKEHCNSFGYAGCVYNIFSFTARNEFSISRLIPQMKISAEQGLEDFMITTWTNGGGQSCVFSPLPALFLAAEYALGNYEPGKELNKAKFEEICDISYDEMYSLTFLDDPFEKKVLSLGNRSFWLLETDILYGNYDMLISQGTREKYLEWSEKYAKSKEGDFKHVFEMESALAKVLAIKCDVAGKIREAYEKGDKEKLVEIRDGDMALLIENMQNFMEVFDKYWQTDSSPFGLEVSHYFFGGVMTRFKYTVKKLTDYIEKDTKIEELEGITLKPSPMWNWDEDGCEEYEINKFFT